MLILLTCLVTITSLPVSAAEGPVIELPNGLIRGREAVTFWNKTYYAFERIPYASPPTGELRFQAPIPPSNWKGTLDTLYLNVSCYQVGSNYDYESEDCLYLNVFTPQLPNGKDVALPVMLFIHGGGFVGGSSIYAKSDRIVEKDIILVSINYRLGPFGFLSTQDDVIPGNSGLKDQHLAIKWVHDNIHLFGGDPEKIIIFGQSAGSASVAYQLLNQQSKGLFRGAILESGTFLSPWAYQRRAREIAFKTASFLNDSFATNNDSVALFKFLQSVDAKELDTASEQYQQFEENAEDSQILQGFYWAPIVEVDNPNSFLTEKMFSLASEGKVVAVPIIIGINSEEGLSFYSRESLTYLLQAFDENPGWMVPNDMQVSDEAKRTEIGTLIKEIYTNGEPLVDHPGDGVRYASDTAFTRSVIKQAELYSKVAATYFYQFSYDGELGGFNIHYPGADNVSHSEEIPYLFCSGGSCDISGYPATDQLTSERLVAIWTNFAKYLNPTPEPSELLQNITWPVVSTENGDFLYLDINEDLEIRNHPKNSTFSKWIELYQSLGNVDFDTY